MIHHCTILYYFVVLSNLIKCTYLFRIFVYIYRVYTYIWPTWYYMVWHGAVPATKIGHSLYKEWIKPENLFWRILYMPIGVSICTACCRQRAVCGSEQLLHTSKHSKHSRKMINLNSTLLWSDPTQNYFACFWIFLSSGWPLKAKTYLVKELGLGVGLITSKCISTQRT